MKKIGILNQEISAVIAGMGHMDTVVIADAGLPIPDETQRIDLALTGGVPGFLETLLVVLEELQVEKAIIAEEMVNTSPEMYKPAQEILKEVPIVKVSHEEFKLQTRSARAVIRTGEFTPYANIILVAGVVF
ncbi:MAG: D-ribose pyranase [Chloroflexota bacterium]|nr:MAG: D-ribose pyranase [Chloroflexota bacterium]